MQKKDNWDRYSTRSFWVCRNPNGEYVTGTLAWLRRDAIHKLCRVMAADDSEADTWGNWDWLRRKKGYSVVKVNLVEKG